MPATISHAPIESLWAVEPSFLPQIVDALRQGPREMAGYSTVNTVNKNGVAVIEVRGVLTKYPSFFQLLFGGAATTDLTQAIQAAVNDQSIFAVCLVCDSPGGGVSGIPGAADAIYAIRKSGKQVIVQVDGMAASAMYYLASQATKIFASHKTDRIGSIGTMQVIEDSSKAAAMEGVEVFVSTTGELKAIGVPGVPLTDSMKAYINGVVKTAQSSFTEAIQRGRGLTPEQLTETSDGRMISAEAAVTAGLIDGIQTLDETIAMLQVSNKSTPKNKGKIMAEATFAELKAECLGAPADFIVQCLDQKLELPQAKANWEAKRAQIQADQQAKLIEAEQKIKTLEAESVTHKAKIAELEKGKEVPAGGAARQGGGSGEATAEQQFREGVNKLVKDGTTRSQAVSQFVRENPEIHAAMLAEKKPQ